MGAQEERRKRLANALRDNLKRRKAQDRGRRNFAADLTDKPDEQAGRPAPALSPAQSAQE